MKTKKLRKEYDVIVTCDGCGFERASESQDRFNLPKDDDRWLCSYCTEAIIEAFYQKPYKITPKLPDCRECKKRPMERNNYERCKPCQVEHQKWVDGMGKSKDASLVIYDQI